MPQQKLNFGGSPLKSLNNTLKRIHINEPPAPPVAATATNMVRTDSFENEWGDLALEDWEEAEMKMEEELISKTIPAKRMRPEINVEKHKPPVYEDEEGSDSLDDFVVNKKSVSKSITTNLWTTISSSTSTSSSSPSRSAPISSSAGSSTTSSATLVSSKHNLKERDSSSESDNYKPEPRARPPPPKKAVAPKPNSDSKRSNNGYEDVFSHDQVKEWSEVRIKTWENRRSNAEGFYYRFCDPVELQHNGPWSAKETSEFMSRLQVWKDRGIRIGTSWGIFSMGVSCKAGYQCSSYYRKLLEKKTLKDPAYEWQGGKLVMINKSTGGEMAVSGLSSRWDTEEVKGIEANVNKWIKEYHSHAASLAPRVPRAMTKTFSTSSNGTITTAARSSSSLMSMGTIFRPTTEAPRVKATTAAAIPTRLSIRPNRNAAFDESEMVPKVDIQDKLAEYSAFMKLSISTSTGPNTIRQTITLPDGSPASGPSAFSVSKALSVVKPLAKATASLPPPLPAPSLIAAGVKKPTQMLLGGTKGQAGLGLFWNIKPTKPECPDIPKYMIPKDVIERPTWAHHILPLSATDDTLEVEGAFTREVDTLEGFDWQSLSDGFSDPVNDIQGLLADPPWNFIVEDGRNDGQCSLSVPAFAEIMSGALETLMPNGIVCVWTHKAILPDVVSIMAGFGCRYVENLVWYKIALNNTHLDRVSPFFRSSKEILLMFKRGEGFDIRHQRTADVIMDFEKPTTAWIEKDYTEPKPKAVYDMMEILLPDARFIPEVGRGRLLELWAKKDAEKRPGWFTIHEIKPSTESLTSTISPSPSSSISGSNSRQIKEMVEPDVEDIDFEPMDETALEFSDFEGGDSAVNIDHDGET